MMNKRGRWQTTIRYCPVFEPKSTSVHIHVDLSFGHGDHTLHLLVTKGASRGVRGPEPWLNVTEVNIEVLKSSNICDIFADFD